MVWEWFFLGIRQNSVAIQVNPLTLAVKYFIYEVKIMSTKFFKIHAQMLKFLIDCLNDL